MVQKTIQLLLIVITITVAGAVGYFINQQQSISFKTLGPDEMYQKIISERDFAISLAVKRGDYKCCIKPPCAMCYMEANEWNNYTPGTCTCDELIAQGKEPCPQCKQGLCESDQAGTCQLDER